MNPRQLVVAVPAALLILGSGAANAGRAHKRCGHHGLRERQMGREGARERTQAGRRCHAMRPHSRRSRRTDDQLRTAWKLRVHARQSWKGTGTCTDNYPGGDKISLTWEEGSHLKEYTYTKTSGTGKYQGVKGGGTYMYQNLSDTLSGGRYKGTIELP